MTWGTLVDTRRALVTFAIITLVVVMVLFAFTLAVFEPVNAAPLVSPTPPPSLMGNLLE